MPFSLHCVYMCVHVYTCVVTAELCYCLSKVNVCVCIIKRMLYRDVCINVSMHE